MIGRRRYEPPDVNFLAPLFRSIGDVEIHTFEGIAGHLRPHAVLLHRNLVDLDVVDGELAGLLVHPEIDVVILVLAAWLAEVGAGEILPPPSSSVAPASGGHRLTGDHSPAVFERSSTVFFARRSRPPR